MSPSDPLVQRLLDDSSFRRYALGEAPPAVVGRWEAWAAETPERAAAAREAATTIRLLRFREAPPEAPETEAAWRRFQAMTRHENASAGEATGRERAPLRRTARPLSPRTAQRRARRQPFVPRGAVAVLLALVLVAGGLWWWQAPGGDTRLVATGPGERTALTLDDGTRITLNARSSLRVVGEGARGTRAVLDGEAFFDVAPQATGTFRVETPDGLVRVVGTQFNVSRRDGATQVVLQEGRVDVLPRTAGEPEAGNAEAGNAEAAKARLGAPVPLRPGQRADFDADAPGVRLRSVNPAVYASWTGPTLLFDETPLAEVVARLEHTYGLDVRVTDPALARRTVSGSVANELDVMLRALESILPCRVERTGPAVTIRPATDPRPSDR